MNRQIAILLVSTAAIIVYGALALVLAFVFALSAGSPTAAALTVLAAGMVYVFQVLQFGMDEGEVPDTAWLGVLPVLVVLMFIASLVMSTLTAYGG